MEAEKSNLMTEKVVDPVCGINVVDGNTVHFTAYGGHLHYFCSKQYRMTFGKNFTKYATTRSSKTKGWFGRFLGRVARANEKKFAGGRATCMSNNEFNHGSYVFLNTSEL